MAVKNRKIAIFLTYGFLAIFSSLSLSLSLIHVPREDSAEPETGGVECSGYRAEGDSDGECRAGGAAAADRQLAADYAEPVPQRPHAQPPRGVWLQHYGSVGQPGLGWHARCPFLSLALSLSRSLFHRKAHCSDGLNSAHEVSDFMRVFVLSNFPWPCHLLACNLPTQSTIFLTIV